MEEQREESEFLGDFREPMEEAGKGLGLSSKTETLVGEDATTSEVFDSGVFDVCGIDEIPNDGDLATGGGSLKAGNSVSDEKQVKADVDDDVKRTDAITEPETEMECEGDTGTVEVKLNDETAKSEVKSNNGASHDETVGEEETVISAANGATDEKATCEVEDNGGVCAAEQDVESEKSQQNTLHVETLSVTENKVDREKETTKKREKDNNKMVVDSKQENEESVALHEQGNHEHAKHSGSAQVPEESTQLSKEETDEKNQKEENGEAMEIDCAAEEQMIKDGKVGGALDNDCNESAGASMVKTQDVPVAEADNNVSNVVEKMEIDERKDNAHMASDLTGTIESADSAISNSPTEDAAPGNIQDLRTETGNVSLKDDKKAADMAEDVATADANLSLSPKGIESELNEARVGVGAGSPAAATDCSKETSDATLGSEENQQGKDHQSLDRKTADQQDTMIEEDDITHEAPSIDPNQKEDAEMEENPNNSDYANDITGFDMKTNGVKRKADVLSEDSPGEGRKTVSFAKVSFAERPSFKIGACIARAASQMAGSSSVLKGSNFDDETLSVESFVSQLHCAATDPVKENVVSDIAAGFFLDFRNSSASQQVTTEKVSKKKGRPSNSNVAGTESFEFEETGDTYWTDRVIHNGGEEQTPPIEKANYQVVPVELKPAQIQRTRRPYRRRQAQINIHLSASDKPANFDENAPAELVMNFSEADTIPPEKSLSKMFRHFGPIKESQTEVDKENNRARVVYKKGADAEVAYNSAGRFSIFGAKAVNYELSYTITETFKVQPYVVSLGEEDAALCLPA
ncbi:unnamed protein product [Arabidopsis lyrata]|uniref:uncharacterized protein LOC9314066 isoform X2 n=1 Tax=Arabidopsis lyrata subsp. lyrata TaxID=81972 RepID=UPI000A29E4D1|nr:uncharacterized protein LOC9314066 isoform X2 [Arabidopsis lyrata subsp. lyrata]CAH8268631.1 unnamed protein product [Arabidopsis lyrata]|eukprot:XP_020882501.1 uncharacterized protein LOC9314066 isoform X2 [Arabidopsis lyrata subsp. lyrata]